jgi:anti-sigma regulatory factor (Ser/Thr protein kinase)
MRIRAVTTPLERPVIRCDEALFASADGLAMASAFAAESLADDHPAIRQAAELLINELATNVVQHADTIFSIRVLFLTDRIRVEVRDGSTALPARRAGSPTTKPGRGVVLLDAVADDWGAEPTPSGKTVWFELERAGY